MVSRVIQLKILFVCGEHNYGDVRRGTGYEYANILPALRNLGHEVVFFESWNKQCYTDFADLNIRLLETVIEFSPDIVFIILMNFEIWLETLDQIRFGTGAYVINWAPDDSWKFRESSRFLLDHVDLHCTTSPVAHQAAQRMGYTNVFLTQWAANSQVLSAPRPARECPIQVSFIGTAYGNRRRWIKGLQRHGIAVQCYGHGWPNGPLTTEQLLSVMRDSVISLNFADSELIFSKGRLHRSRQIKARTFEVPGAGGFLLTEMAPGLHAYYEPDNELVTFNKLDDLAVIISDLLQNPDKRDAIAGAAHKRTLSCHTYEHRLSVILEHVQSTRLQSPLPVKLNADPLRSTLVKLAECHTRRGVAHYLKTVLVIPARILFGSRRGPRAARKFLYALYWRLFGAKTYRAMGLPGRLFYRES